MKSIKPATGPGTRAHRQAERCEPVVRADKTWHHCGAGLDRPEPAGAVQAGTCLACFTGQPTGQSELTSMMDPCSGGRRNRRWCCNLRSPSPQIRCGSFFPTGLRRSTSDRCTFHNSAEFNRLPASEDAQQCAPCASRAMSLGWPMCGLRDPSLQ